MPTYPLPIENVLGSPSGRPNLVVYHGPALDLDGADSPVTAANTLAIDRWDAATGARQTYVPGAGSNPWHVLDADGVGGVTGRGRTYLIHARADFALDHCCPGERVEEVP